MNSKRLYFFNILNSILPPSSFNSLKTKLLRWAGIIIGNNCEISGGAKIVGNGNLLIGNNVFIGMEALIMINEGSTVEIQDYSIIGTRSTIVTGFHPITPDGPRIIGYEGTNSKIKICKGSSVGTRVLILPGITVNEMSHCAAGSVVTKDVPPFTRVGGVPAKFMKKLNE